MPFLLREAAGALGDLGTFVPLAVGMVQIAGIDAGTLLVTAGLANIYGGFAFRIPMAVQPMKAICALAIAGSLSGPQAVVAGLCVGVSMAVLGLFGLVRTLGRLVPNAVLRALQLTVAAELLVSGLRFAFARASAGAGDADDRCDAHAVVVAPPVGMGGDRSAGGGIGGGCMEPAVVAERAARRVVAATLDARSTCRRSQAFGEAGCHRCRSRC